MNTATTAVLIKNGTIIGYTKTTARNGATVAFGTHKLEKGAILEAGRAKVSRAKKYLDNKELMYEIEDNFYYVNNSNYLDA